MRMLPILAALLVACADPYADAEKANTIEAWEAFLATSPSDTQRLKAEASLEGLLVAKAEASKKVEDYDAVLSRFPNTRKKDELRRARAGAAFAAAETENTAEAWKKYLDENDGADAGLEKKARGYISVVDYGKIVVPEATVEQVNLAEDPKGPKDGWGFSAEVKNDGDKTIEYLNFDVVFLDASGAKLDVKSYPLVAKTAPGGMPIEEEFQKPLEPGQSRRFFYATGEVPENWSKQVRLVPSSVRFLGTEGEAKAE
jgi:hypothetical protein